MGVHIDTCLYTTSVSIAVSSIFETGRPLLTPYHPFPLYYLEEVTQAQKKTDASKKKTEALLKQKQATATALKAFPKTKKKKKTKPKSKKEFLDAARKKGADMF